ncbi:MAG: hypothetical protein ABEI74_03440 [Candidatus Pacearchaeota archaeon]
MERTLNMQDLRYINLFSKITKVNTKDFFEYNGTLFFCVPKNLVSKALGENTQNLKKIREVLGKKAKILPKPEGNKDIKNFIQKVIEPVNVRSIEVDEEEITANATKPNKASLIGRDRKKLREMNKITQSFFGKQFNVT